MRLHIIVFLCMNLVGYCLHGQAPHLDVEGHTKIRGNIDINHRTDSTSMYIGRNSGRPNSSGSSNTFLGVDTGPANLGQSNTFIGENSGFKNSTGRFNTFVGRHAGFDNFDGSNNTFFGASAGSKNISGSKNAFFGYDAGYKNEDGDENSFFGHESGFNNTSGFGNAFLGFEAGFLNSSGFDNTFIGKSAGSKNSTGDRNVFVGFDAGQNHTTGDFNTFLGPFAGDIHESGNKNVAVGTYAGFLNVKGNRNTFLGSDAGVSGSQMDSLNNVIAIGYNAEVGCSNCAVIGGTGADSVKVGIGVAVPEQVLDVNGNARFRKVGNYPGFGNTPTAVFMYDNGTLVLNSSDLRLKENAMPLVNVLQKLRKVSGYRYNYKSNSNKSTEIGVIAQEMEQAFPELVFTNKHTGYKGVHYEKITAVLLQAIKEQQQQIELLQDKVQILENQN